MDPQDKPKLMPADPDVPPAVADANDVGSAAIESFAQDARRDARMLRDDQPLTDDLIKAVRDRARDYYQRRNQSGKFTLDQFAAQLGQVTTGRGKVKVVAGSVLSEVLSGKYKGTIEPYIRRLDAFLSRERMRDDRFRTERFVEIELARRVRGVVHQAKRHGTMGVVIMEPGQGKSTIARACAQLDSATRLITIETGEGHPQGVLRKLYEALQIPGVVGDRSRRKALKSALRNNKTIVILVDEAQKLTSQGLEVLRDLHDNAHPDDASLYDDDRTIPMVLFGDLNFYALIKQGRRGHGRVTSQLTSRMAPIFDSAQAGNFPGRPKGRNRDLYGEADLVKILRQDKLRIFTGDAIAYLTVLANLRSYGGLRTVVRTCETAYDLARGDLIDVKRIKQALRTRLTKETADLICGQVETQLAERNIAVATATA